MQHFQAKPLPVRNQAQITLQSIEAPFQLAFVFVA
jgi:hypothetical protein